MIVAKLKRLPRKHILPLLLITLGLLLGSIWTMNLPQSDASITICQQNGECHDGQGNPVPAQPEIDRTPTGPQPTQSPPDENGCTGGPGLRICPGAPNPDPTTAPTSGAVQAPQTGGNTGGSTSPQPCQ